MIENGTATSAQIEAMWAALRADIDAAITFAEDSPLPDADQVLVDVYTGGLQRPRSERKITYAAAFNEAVRLGDGGRSRRVLRGRGHRRIRRCVPHVRRSAGAVR